MIPDSILLSSITETPNRSQYNGIEKLAESIQDSGLIQPLVLVPLANGTYGLDAGHRRRRALELLGHTTVYHASSCDPGRPGFVLKGEDKADPFSRLKTKIAENLDREDLHWKDALFLIVEAWKEAKRTANLSGEKLLMRDFGVMLGVGYMDLRAAVAVEEHLRSNPDRFSDCTSIRGALGLILKDNAAWLSSQAATKSLVTTPLHTPVRQVSSPVSEQPVPEPEAIPNIPLTSAFHCGDARAYMASLPDGSFDHIVTDPDYGVSVERLEAGVSNASDGVHHESVEASLTDIAQFLKQAFRITKESSFVVFWYDLDHHEKLQRLATLVGFRVQRWPLTWRKTDYRSNASPQSNFCKNEEWAMVCRKPGATLTKPQMSSVFDAATGSTTRDLGHPFAKPPEVWRFIYQAIAIAGQSVFDPFCGSGSAPLEAIRFGLRASGCEVNPDHYGVLLHNLQKQYRAVVGDNVTFS